MNGRREGTCQRSSSAGATPTTHRFHTRQFISMVGGDGNKPTPTVKIMYSSIASLQTAMPYAEHRPHNRDEASRRQDHFRRDRHAFFLARASWLRARADGVPPNKASATEGLFQAARLRHLTLTCIAALFAFVCTEELEAREDASGTNATKAQATRAQAGPARVSDTPYYDTFGRYSAGWTSAHHAVLGDGRNCILFLMGLGSNNSVRCFEPEKGRVSLVQPDTESDGNVDGPGINDRDNHLSLHIPGRGLFITGGAYLTNKPWHAGYFDYKQMKWTHRWGPDEREGEGLIEGWGKLPYQPFNAAVAWSEEHDFGVIVGGSKNSTPTKRMIYVYPNADGTFRVKLGKAPEACGHMRNSMVIVDSWAYLVGGKCKDGRRKKVNWFRRFNIKTNEWQRLEPFPFVPHYPDVNFDPVERELVVYGGSHSKDRILYTYNVDTGGPWRNHSATAGLPPVTMPIGDYDPVTRLHCWRGGIYGDGQGKSLSWTRSADIHCARFKDGKLVRVP